MRSTTPLCYAPSSTGIRVHYNTVRLHAAIGYVTPDDEHQGRGPAIRTARRDGLRQARVDRIEYHRNNNPPETS